MHAAPLLLQTRDDLFFKVTTIIVVDQGQRAVWIPQGACRGHDQVRASAQTKNFQSSKVDLAYAAPSCPRGFSRVNIVPPEEIECLMWLDDEWLWTTVPTNL